MDKSKYPTNGSLVYPYLSLTYGHYTHVKQVIV